MRFWYVSGDDGPQRAPYVSFVMGLCWHVRLLENLEGLIEMRPFFHSIAIALAMRNHCKA